MQRRVGPLCARHHALKHHGGWQLEQPTPGWFRWTSPLNHTAEGGHVLQTVRTSQSCFAVEVIYRPQGSSVLCCTAATSNPTVAAAQRTGRLEIAPATTSTEDA